MDNRSKSALLNLISLCTGAWGLYRATRVKLPATLAEAGHRQFLTNIAVVATLITNVVNLVAWKRTREGGSDGWRLASRQLALPVALVLESVVAAVYWPLRLFWLPLIMHNVKDGSKVPLPVPVDCAIHLLPVVYLAVDYLVLERAPFQMSKTSAWAIVTLLGFGYSRYLTVLVDRDAGAVYPYPFLDVAEPWRSGIFVVVTNIAWVWFVFYKRVHGLVRTRPKTS
ncbi:LADA_0E02586g1_1 [Lachancea dasiensis]|uniref:LADA_0E02586g1_1 n=1 Tax=Lachancea dasiensis TaxID=1072105 RepID=A0A1G4JAT5_9SACH|nr:LADA_0E02586g1_1 [Lachancea dasiensis]